MITLLTGENTYEIEQSLAGIVADFEGEAEKYDGEGLEEKDLADIMAGQTLFADNRLVVIRGLSKNRQLWEAVPDWIGRMSDSTYIVLIEPAVDKRLKTYNALQKNAVVKDMQHYSERDRVKMERWVLDEAKQKGVNINGAAARRLLERSLMLSAKGQPVYDQWHITHSLEKLSVLEEVTPDTVEKYIDDQPVSSVFAVFETALRGDAGKLHTILADIQLKEDPFRVMGLLSGQIFQLAAMITADKPTQEVAKDLGVHPFAVQKLAPFAEKLKLSDIAEIVAAFIAADETIKLSKAEPWILIEQALMKVAVMAKKKNNSAG